MNDENTQPPASTPTPDPKALTLKDIKTAEQALSQILMAKVDFKLAYRTKG